MGEKKGVKMSKKVKERKKDVNLKKAPDRKERDFFWDGTKQDENEEKLIENSKKQGV